MDGLTAALMKKFPDCDLMMAETIVKMHQQGKLSECMESATHLEPKGGSISVVANEELKTLPTITEWSEDKSPASSSSTPP